MLLFVKADGQRFKDKEAASLKETKFPPHFSEKVSKRTAGRMGDVGTRHVVVLCPLYPATSVIDSAGGGGARASAALSVQVVLLRSNGVQDD